jgi:hypothetical protein
MQSPQQTGTPTGAYAAPTGNGGNSQRTAYIAGGVALATAAGILIGLKAFGLLGAKTPTTPTAGILAAPQTQTAPAPVLAAPQVNVSAPPPAPVLAPAPNEGAPMPDDVARWLRWLKKIEAYRRQLKNESDVALVTAYAEMIKAPLQEMMKEPDDIKDENMVPTKAFEQIGAISAKWNQLAAVFQAGPQPPVDWNAGKPNLPDPCAPTATAYNQLLTTIVQQQAQLQQLAQSGIQSAGKSGGAATPDVQNILSQLYGQANGKGMSRTADAAFTQADTALNSLRARYTSVPADVDRAQLYIQDQGSISVPSAPTMPTF